MLPVSPYLLFLLSIYNMYFAITHIMHDKGFIEPCGLAKDTAQERKLAECNPFFYQRSLKDKCGNKERRNKHTYSNLWLSHAHSNPEN